VSNTTPTETLTAPLLDCVHQAESATGGDPPPRSVTTFNYNPTE